MAPHLIFLNSPLMGSYTWQSVAYQLAEQGYAVMVPELIDHANTKLPYWQQEVSNLHLPVERGFIIAHSGAGALAPFLAEKLQVSGYLFVDAVLLFEPATRLQLMAQEAPAFAETFEAYLRAGGVFPNWTSDGLAAGVPDETIRNALLDDMRPRPLGFFTERIPPPEGWQRDAPCGYIQLSESYTHYAQQAAARGWVVQQHSSHHFAMLTHPGIIARLITHMIEMFNET